MRYLKFLFHNIKSLKVKRENLCQKTLKLILKIFSILDGWKIYYLNIDKGVISTAFCYENNNGCYLYNSSRDNEFNSLNPGIVLNDLIIQGLIHNGKSFFDFLKGTERYKFDLGGKSVQLYDVNLIL